MKRNIIIGCFLCLVIMSVSAQTTRQEVLKKTEALNKAVFITKDSAALESLLSDKVTYGHSNGKLQNKQVMIHNAIIDAMTYPGFKMDSTVIVIDGNTAVVRQIIKSKTINKGVEGNLHLGILLVWVNERKDWKLIARQAVKM